MSIRQIFAHIFASENKVSETTFSEFLEICEGYKDLPKRKMGMKAGKKIISALGDAVKAGGETDERTIEAQVRTQKANKKAKQADKIHDTASKHNETLSKAKSSNF